MSIRNKERGERWADCYRIGREASREMPTFATEDQIAAEFGFKSRQEAHWQCLVALGKLVIRCRKSLKKEI